MGQPMDRNCPFGDGTGYGDGRAVSIAEVVVDGQRWEMQLKGGGTTPFCRGADGRAVLRSSIREFLASEAMYHLGVDTTRALSLVVSETQKVMRPWYSGGRSQDPDTMISEHCAITTRVAPSFLRVGHLDLFARRARRQATPAHLEEHRQILEHALFREYPEVAAGSLRDRTIAMLESAAVRLARLVSGWLRVGFCQGNFNADNCLISGRTMDYGPFGWIEQYDPLFAKWIGSGDHFAFMNQPDAAVANYFTLVSAAVPVLGEGDIKIRELVQLGDKTIREAVQDTFRAKLGFPEGSKNAAACWTQLEPLMKRSSVDYTIFWRQLAAIAEQCWESEPSLALLDRAFYEKPSNNLVTDWTTWLRKWLTDVSSESTVDQVIARLRATNPKYVPREWMLVQAYTAADKGNYDLVHELYKLFQNPYDEQPEFEEKYFRGASREMLTKGGCAHMS